MNIDLHTALYFLKPCVGITVAIGIILNNISW